VRVREGTGEVGRPGQRRAFLIVGALFFVMLCYPPLYTMCKVGLKGVFAYLAQDSFYYLTVAKNSALGFWTFDGETPTNGFHPFWQYLLTLLFGFTESTALAAQLYITYFASVLLVVGGFILTGAALYRVTRSVFMCLWLIPGPFYLLLTAPETITYSFSPWAFMNGMETPLSIFLCGIFMYIWASIFVRIREEGSLEFMRKGRSIVTLPVAAAMGVAVSLMIMTRLDDVFLLLAVALSFLFLGGPWKDRMKQTAVLIAPAAILLALYGAYNLSQGLTFIPVSGLVKCSPTAAFSGNFTTFLSDLFPPLHELIRPDKYRLTGWQWSTARSTAMVLPIAFALTALTLLPRKESGSPGPFPENLWFSPLLLYILFKGTYNLLNVRIFDQGYWYYPVSVLMLNFIVIVLVWQWAQANGFRPTRRVRILGIAVFALVYCFNTAGVISKGVSYDGWQCRLWENRTEVAEQLRNIRPNVKLVDRTDAVLSYMLPFPSVTMSGFVTDRKGHAARAQGRILEYYVKRGFDVTHDGVPAWHLPKTFLYTRIHRHDPTGIGFMDISAGFTHASAPAKDVRSSKAQ
jgi:hypothetical protein